ncbi:TetR/AcrR family transcriptional regulator [Zavarzinia sp.]|uniref:TetR/AcrR family transcriptional regulator n=1 Tax=Zavarzinia sp. TaxID=2027920 RepID=UPI003565E844
MGKRDDNREERRRRILAAAAAGFAERGFHGTGMAEIAAAAGITPANLYRYFDAKEAIVRAIVDEQREAVAVAVQTAERRADALDAVLGLFGHFMAEARSPQASRLWLEILAEVARNPRVADAFTADDGLVKQGFASLLRRGMAEGTVRADLDLEATVIWLIALVDGAVGRVAVEPAFDLDRASRPFFDLIRRALAPAIPVPAGPVPA